MINRRSTYVIYIMIYLSLIVTSHFYAAVFRFFSTVDIICSITHFLLLTFDRLQICVHTWITNDNTRTAHAHAIFFSLSLTLSKYIYLCVYFKYT